IQAATVPNGPDAGKDRIYVGSQDRTPMNNPPFPATIDLSLDAAASSPTTQGVVVENRTVVFDGNQTRPAIHIDGTVYAVYYSIPTNPSSSDVVIVRDDNWASGTTPFNALVDRSDPMNPKQGIRIVTGVNNPLPANQNIPFQTLGQQRMTGDLSIAVDPN